MCDKTFVIGLGLGMVAGSMLGRMMAPKPKKSPCQAMMERCIKNVGNVIEDVSDVLSK